MTNASILQLNKVHDLLDQLNHEFSVLSGHGFCEDITGVLAMTQRPEEAKEVVTSSHRLLFRLIIIASVVDIWQRPTPISTELAYLGRADGARRSLEILDDNDVPNHKRMIKLLDLLREWPHYAQLQAVEREFGL